jgi:signal transduction histidine kinase
MNHTEKTTRHRGTAQHKLASALRLQRLLAEISSRFVTSPQTATREIIESAQRSICETLGLDRSTLWLFSDDGLEMALTCYWQRPGSPPLRRNFVTRGNLPWADRQIREAKSFNFSSLADLPPEADRDREIFRLYGTKANVTFPLVTHGRVFGALAFAKLTDEHLWTDEEVASLELISQIFSHVIGKRRAEERADQLRDEIQRSSRAAVLGELAAALAHEINQPLTTILSNAQAARRFITRGSAETHEILAILDDIIRADKRAAGVVRNLREMLGDKPAQRELLCLNELVAESCALFANDPVNEGIDLMFDPGHVPAHIKLASVEIQQLLANLIANASHAMSGTPPDRRRILIQTRADEDMVHLHVRDHGHGIPPEHLDRIFEPFHTTRPDGLGMGLAICRRIAEAHGGTLKAANHQSGGAVFTFSLPFVVRRPEPTGTSRGSLGRE